VADFPKNRQEKTVDKTGIFMDKNFLRVLTVIIHPQHENSLHIIGG